MEQTSKMNKKWTAGDEEILLELAGFYSLTHIANVLGRSKKAIKLRLEKLGITNLRLLNGRLRASELAEMLGVSSSTIQYWVHNKGLPYYKNNLSEVREASYRIKTFDLDRFWKWAKKNQDVLDFRKIPIDTIRNAPEWVWELRKEKNSNTALSHRRIWTKAEEDYLLFAMRGNSPSLKALANHFQRGEDAIYTKMKRIAKKHNIVFSVHNDVIRINKPRTILEEAELKYQKDIKTLLNEWYWDEGLTHFEIAERLGCHQPKTGYISHLFKKYEIPVRKFDSYEIKIGGNIHKVTGRHPSNGSFYIKVQSHPRKNSRGYVLESHVLMEIHLGRYLRCNEIVCFRNKDKTDLSMENLFIKTIKFKEGTNRSIHAV